MNDNIVDGALICSYLLPLQNLSSLFEGQFSLELQTKLDGKHLSRFRHGFSIESLGQGVVSAKGFDIAQ